MMCNITNSCNILYLIISIIPTNSFNCSNTTLYIDITCVSSHLHFWFHGVGPWRATESRYTWTSPWKRPRKTTPKRGTILEGVGACGTDHPGVASLRERCHETCGDWRGNFNINGHDKWWFYVRKLQWKWMNMVGDFMWFYLDTCYVMVGEVWDTSGNLTVCCGNNMDFLLKKHTKWWFLTAIGSLLDRKCQNIAWNIMELMMGSLTQKNMRM